MLKRNLLNTIRKKEYVGPFLFLIDFYNAENNIFLRLTNYDKDFIYKSQTYKEFPFLLSIPAFTEGIGKQLLITFANFIHNGTNPKDAELSQKIAITYLNINFITNPIYEKSFYFFNEGDRYTVDLETVQISLSRNLLKNTLFPFNKYNSINHPSLYEDRGSYESIVVK